MKHVIIKQFAESFVSKSVNSACMLWVYQPKIPEVCKKYKKLK